MQAILETRERINHFEQADYATVPDKSYECELSARRQYFGEPPLRECQKPVPRWDREHQKPVFPEPGGTDVGFGQALGHCFAHLAKKWKRETWFHSSVTDKCMHPAYLQIIGMGKDAVPLILSELKQHGGHWFWALRAITGANPVADEYRGQMDKMTEAWLKWGRGNGYAV